MGGGIIRRGPCFCGGDGGGRRNHTPRPMFLRRRRGWAEESYAEAHACTFHTHARTPARTHTRMHTHTPRVCVRRIRTSNQWSSTVGRRLWAGRSNRTTRRGGGGGGLAAFRTHGERPVLGSFTSPSGATPLARRRRITTVTRSSFRGEILMCKTHVSFLTSRAQQRVEQR